MMPFPELKSQAELDRKRICWPSVGVWGLAAVIIVAFWVAVARWTL